MTRPDRFEILGIDLDVPASTVTGRWAIDDEVFTETAVVPGGDLSLPGVAGAAELWCLLAGVSYFKTKAPRRLDLGPIRTTATEREFLRRFYVAGLGEFALGNGIDLSDLLVAGPEGSGPADRTIGDPGRVLIPFGGGLDSIVTVAELVPQADEAALFVVERPGSRFEAIEAPAAATGLEVVRVERMLDPKVLESTARGYLNGHVPVTGVISALAVLAAVATGHGAVAMSNERSASSAKPGWVPWPTSRGYATGRSSRSPRSWRDSTRTSHSSARATAPSTRTRRVVSIGGAEPATSASSSTWHSPPSCRPIPWRRSSAALSPSCRVRWPDSFGSWSA